MAILTVPGRVELAGNHTDHQHGRVLVSAIHLCIQADFTANSDSVIRLRSQKYGEMIIPLNQLSVRPPEFGTPVSMVRGVAAAFQDQGFPSEASTPPSLPRSQSASGSVLPLLSPCSSRGF